MGTAMMRRASGAADPFGTARLRQAVLAAWAASPARFREDANAEEELALGAYRDRLVVELAQNAADAAARAQAPGRLRLTLHPASADRPPLLAASNTGAPLDASGVESLSTLRASAKRPQPPMPRRAPEGAVRPEGAAVPERAVGPEDVVGRFGVGFSAVLAVTDEPAVISRNGGVRWALAEARELADEAAEHIPPLADELRRRGGHVPLLRLPLPAEGTPPVGYDTVVVLPLRDGAAEDLALRLLTGIDDALLLALPGLAEVVIETPESSRTLTQARPSVTGPSVTCHRPSAELRAAPPYAAPPHAAQSTVTVRDSAAGATSWRVETAGGRLEDALLAGRPVEERLHPEWSVTWAVPVGPGGEPRLPRTAPVLHAPTPTDEPLALPALLIATLPLDSSRRRAAPGPLTDFLLDRAAETYARLIHEWRPVGLATLDLVPGPLGRGELDAALRRRILALLPNTAFLPSAPSGAAAPPATGTVSALSDHGDAAALALRPRDAELVEGAGSAALGLLVEVFPALLPAGLERRVELRTLGVARVPFGEVIDRLAGLDRAPSWWCQLYEALAGANPEMLTGLPVPLADGRTVIGPRQVLLPLPAGPEAGLPTPLDLTRLGLKVAHPDAAHPLLEKLGALPATPRAVLTTPQLRAAVAASLDGEIGPGLAAGAGGQDQPDSEELADVVLALVQAAGLGPGDEPWLGALALPADEGELACAGDLVLPGSPVEAVIREGELAACAPELLQRWGEQPLTAAGVLANFGLVRAHDVVLDPDELELDSGVEPWADDITVLDAVDVWCEDVLDQLPDCDVPPVATEIVAVRDLDLVDDAAWPQVLAMLARPPLRDALVEPVRVLLPDGSSQPVRPYTAWWLRDNPVLDGRRPVGLRVASPGPGPDLLRGLYDEAHARAGVPLPDNQVLRCLGVRTTVAALLDEPGGAAELLARLAEPDRTVEAAQLHGLYAALAELGPDALPLPDELRAVVGRATRVVDAGDALVADAPDLLPLAPDVPLLPAPPRLAADLAELLQVRRLSEVFSGEVVSEGEPRQVPDTVRALLPLCPDTFYEHAELSVSASPERGVREVDWRWVDGVLHASTLLGVAAGLAWAAGQWQRRFEVAAVFAEPERAAELAQDRWFD